MINFKSAVLNLHYINPASISTGSEEGTMLRESGSMGTMRNSILDVISNRISSKSSTKSQIFFDVLNISPIIGTLVELGPSVDREQWSLGKNTEKHRGCWGMQLLRKGNF